MNERTLNLLEFPKIIDRLKAETITPIGKAYAEQLYPSIHLHEIQEMQDETDEAVQILRLNKEIPIAPVIDVTDLLKQSKIGRTLDAQSCLAIAKLINTTRKVKTFIETIDAEIPLLKDLVSHIFSLQHLEKNIMKKIDEQGHMYDNASPTLRGIRQSIRSQEVRIRDRFKSLIKRRGHMLSDQIVTIRNDRYVLPVKHDHRSTFGGIVHDQSASGQTLFIEPNSVVELNNSLQQSLIKEQQEIEQILRLLTKEIATHKDEILKHIKTIGTIDLIYAKGKLSQKLKGAKPSLNNAGIIDLKQARHPLIPEDEIVANDIALGKDFEALVITGPNTGGKTVTLKTIGLCTLMAQSGIQVPALDGCKLAVFEKIYADIGDEQSIEQNLSTFSSHMTNIVNIMDNINERSLVLLDELGAGTDPQEGAALAMALLDEVIDRQARVVATTHYPELKAYGYNRESIMNASVEFDIDTLQPTYRLIMGVPGKSNAFEISNRLGLHNRIIDRAKSYLGVDSKNVENMISKLEYTRKQAEEKFFEANNILKESEQYLKDLKAKWDEFLQHRNRLYEEAEQKAEGALQKAREEAELIVDEVRKMKDETLWKEHEWIEARKLLDEAQPTLTKTAKQSEKSMDESFLLEEGDEIKHRKLQQKGQIIERLNNEEYTVQIGALRVTANRKDLQYIGKKEDPLPEKPITTVVTNKAPVKTELDLRGKRYEEAMRLLEEYIDRAMMQGHNRLTIIHGRGTGALRRGVEQFIKQSPYIKASRLGGEGEGGSGVTILEL